jgi:hypothetical protein
MSSAGEGRPASAGPPRAAPRIYYVRLPLLWDIEAKAVHRMTAELALYEPQALALGLLPPDGLESGITAPVVLAQGFGIDREGIVLYLTKRAYRHNPERWAEAYDACGLTGFYEGLQGLAALRAISMQTGLQTRKRGQRGSGKRRQYERDFLLSAALVRIARGMSYRVAVCDALSEYDDITPWRFEVAQNALLVLVSRFIRKGRLRDEPFFVHSPPDPLR